MLALLLSQETKIQTVNMESTSVAHAVTPSIHAAKRFRKNDANKFNDTRFDFGQNNNGWCGWRRGRGRDSFTCLISQLCQRPWHTANRCYNRFDRDFKPHSNNNNLAFYSFLDLIASLEWFLDSGATNHITNDQGKLQAFVGNS